MIVTKKQEKANEKANKKQETCGPFVTLVDKGKKDSNNDDDMLTLKRANSINESDDDYEFKLELKLMQKHQQQQHNNDNQIFKNVPME